MQFVKQKRTQFVLKLFQKSWIQIRYSRYYGTAVASGQAQGFPCILLGLTTKYLDKQAHLNNQDLLCIP